MVRMSSGTTNFGIFCLCPLQTGKMSQKFQFFIIKTLSLRLPWHPEGAQKSFADHISCGVEILHLHRPMWKPLITCGY